MRKLVAMALVLVGCGGETAISVQGQALIGQWDLLDDSGITWESFAFGADGQYSRVFWTAPLPPGEAGEWAVAGDGLHLSPAGGMDETHPWELAGARLRIWWPPHLLREYARFVK